MMDSAIEISSGSDDEEVPEPIREENKTRRNPTWLGGIVSAISLSVYCLSRGAGYFVSFMN